MARSLNASLIVVACLWLISNLANADTFALTEKRIDLIGSITTDQSRYEDTLLDIARAYGLGYTEIVRANPGVDPWLPGEGTEIRLPRQFILPPVERRGIVINLAEMRIYYFPEPTTGTSPVVISYPISIGRMDWSTPLSQAHIVSRIKDPAWYPPPSIREEHAARGNELPTTVTAGPNNPLGRYALQLSIPGYLIHGTNKPWTIGMRTTHGCIRLRPEDIEKLYQQVPTGTPVRIINMPNKVGWADGRLYLEVHPALDDDRENREKGMTGVVELLISATHGRQVILDWNAIRETYREATGIPTPISLSAD